MNTRINRLDFFGIAASALCSVHCLAMPALLLAMPAADRWGRQLENGMLAASLITAAACLWRALRRPSPSIFTVALFALGAAALCLSRLVDESVELPILVSASAMLIGGHWRNCGHCDHTC